MNKIGKYHVIEQLGAGGVGTVFRVADKRADGYEKHYALKVISLANPQVEARFLNEAVTGSRLHHDHIIQTHDYGIFDDAHGQQRSGFIVTDLIDGLNLRQICKRGRHFGGAVSPAQALTIGLALFDALHYAWTEARDGSNNPIRLIHRDIKPTNVMLTRGGAVKLLDLGLVRAISNPNPTFVQVLSGTIPYMSPEQLAVHELDCRADIFSVGALIYELLAGQRLYPEQGQDLLRAVGKADTQKPLKLIEDKPPGIKEFLAQLLKKHAKDRIQSHSECVAACEVLLSKVPGSTNLSTLTRQLMKDSIATEVIDRNALGATTKLKVESLNARSKATLGQSESKVTLIIKRDRASPTQLLPDAGPEAATTLLNVASPLEALIDEASTPTQTQFVNGINQTLRSSSIPPTQPLYTQERNTFTSAEGQSPLRAGQDDTELITMKSPIRPPSSKQTVLLIIGLFALTAGTLLFVMFQAAN